MEPDTFSQQFYKDFGHFCIGELLHFCDDTVRVSLIAGGERVGLFFLGGSRWHYWMCIPGLTAIVDGINMTTDLNMGKRGEVIISIIQALQIFNTNAYDFDIIDYIKNVIT